MLHGFVICLDIFMFNGRDKDVDTLYKFFKYMISNSKKEKDHCLIERTLIESF